MARPVGPCLIARFLTLSCEVVEVKGIRRRFVKSGSFSTVSEERLAFRLVSTTGLHRQVASWGILEVHFL